MTPERALDIAIDMLAGKSAHMERRKNSARDANSFQHFYTRYNELRSAYFELKRLRSTLPGATL